MVRQPDEVRLFLATAVIPFIKAGCGDDAAAVLDGMAEGGFLGHCFGTGVYQVAAKSQVFGPTRHKSPL